MISKKIWWKKVTKSIIFIILCCCLTFSVFELLFDNKKEISINKNNYNEITNLLLEEYEKPEEITKVKLKVMLGDGELYLYRGLRLEQKKLIGEDSYLFQYLIEKGSDSGEKYIIFSSIFLIGILSLTRNNNL